MHMSASTAGDFLRRMAGFFVDSCIYCAFVPPTLTLATIVLTKNPFNWQLLLLPFFACVLIYSLNRITDHEEDSISMPDRTRFPHRLRIMLLAGSLVLYLIFLMMMLQKNLLSFAIGLFPLVLALGYSVFRLKRVLILKNIIIAVACGASILIVPAYYETWDLICAFLFLFFFVLMVLNTIIFDIKDIRGDSVCGIETFPVRFGIPATQYFCCFLLAMAGIIFYPLIYLNHDSLLLIPYLVTIAAYTFFVREREFLPWWYFGVLVDGEFLVLLFCLLIAMLLQ
jgi:4-hydroxybenzoate polyprenyltransferase